MISVGNMIKRLDGLCGTKDISDREEDFIESIVRRTRNGEHTSDLSEPQLKWINDLFNKHFAG